MSDTHYSLEAAIEQLQRIEAAPGGHPWRLVIRKHNPGAMAGHQTTEVQAIHAGFDWEAGRVVIEPAKPLTELTPEQVDDISKSVRTGGSWHAYQRQKKLSERVDALEAENKRLRDDAERYRWLRNEAVRFGYDDKSPSPWVVSGHGPADAAPCEGDELDAAVDAGRLAVAMVEVAGTTGEKA